MNRTELASQVQKLEERVQELEEMVSLAKAKCRSCGAIFIILPTTKYVMCQCGERFGDAHMLLGEPLEANPENIEWVNKDGYERDLLLCHVRSEINRTFPRALANTRVRS
jgi:hypothetical protein